MEENKVKEIVDLYNRRMKLGKALDDINKMGSCLAFAVNTRDENWELSYSVMGFKEIEDVLKRHHDMILKEIKEEIEDLDVMLKEL